jgi:hypothetical protein
MSRWLRELFNEAKPVIAMAHVPALPGTPRYDADAGMAFLIQRVRSDVEHLLEGGVDAIMYCNEDDRPYVFEAGIEQIAALTRVVAETAPAGIPFGVDFLWDPMAAMAVAAVTGATFIREVLSGTYESDMGLWSPHAGRVLRFRRQIDADHVRVFYNVQPEFAASVGSRGVAERARSVVVSCLADAILVSGPMAGVHPDYSVIEEVKASVREVPVFLNTGSTPQNIGEYLKVADGVIVGSALKVGGYTWNPVDPERVDRFMAAVTQSRQAVS